MLNTKLALVSAFAFANFAFTSAAKVIITDLFYDTEKFYTDITIGNPQQTFHVALDTNSTLTWVHGIECPKVDCHKTRFNNFGDVASKGYKSVGDGYEQYYSFDAMNKKSYIAGFLGTDIITLGQFTVEQDFSPVFESHKMFKYFADRAFIPEGVLGLGVSPTIPTRTIKSLKSVSTPHPYTSFVRNLAEKGLIDKAFSLYFGDKLKKGVSNGEFVLGGFNVQRVTEAPHYIPVYHPGGPNADIPWQAFGQAFKVYELSASAESQATLEEPPSVLYEERFYRDKNELFRFATATPFSKLKQEYNNRLYKTKILSMSFSHQQDDKTDPKPVHVEFPLSKLVIPYYGKSNRQLGCLWGPQNTEYDSQEMYLGQDILRNLYMTFDFDEYRIGLAYAKDTPTKIIV